MTTRKPSLLLPLFGLLALACGPEDDPEPLTQPNVPVASENGYFEVTVAPETGDTWPDWAVGPTRIKALIKPGPDPLPKAPVDDVKLPADPPYTIVVKAPIAGKDRLGPVPSPLPLDTDRTHWALADVDLRQPGYWIVPIEISNDEGLVDNLELRFEVE